MPSFTIYADSDDVNMFSSGTWTQARDGSNGPIMNTGSSSHLPGYIDSSGTAILRQVLMHFDTSAVSGTESSTELSIQNTGGAGPACVLEAGDHTWTVAQGSAAFLAGASAAAHYAAVSYGSAIRYSHAKTNPVVTRSATYGVALFMQGFRTNTQPGATTYANIWGAEASGTADDPYLSITTVTSVSLTVDNASHAHAATSPSILATASATINGATHAHASTSPTLAFIPSLVPANATHAHAATSPTLIASIPLAVSNAAHAHSATSPALVPHAVLAVNDNYHGHVATSPTLAFGTVLAIDSASHGHLATSPILSRITGLVTIAVGGDGSGRAAGTRSYASSSARDYRAGGGRSHASMRRR